MHGNLLVPFSPRDAGWRQSGSTVVHVHEHGLHGAHFRRALAHWRVELSLCLCGLLGDRGAASKMGGVAGAHFFLRGDWRCSVRCNGETELRQLEVSSSVHTCAPDARGTLPLKVVENPGGLPHVGCPSLRGGTPIRTPRVGGQPPSPAGGTPSQLPLGGGAQSRRELEGQHPCAEWHA